MWLYVFVALYFVCFDDLSRIVMNIISMYQVNADLEIVSFDLVK